MRSASRPERIDIGPHTAALVAYLASQDDVLAAYLYGSYGTAYQTALSDVDLAVLFYQGKRPDMRRLLALEAGISSVCREDDINVLSLNDADVMLQFRVLDTAVPIFEREPDAVSDFREYVFKIYGDFAPFYRASCKEYDSTLREAYVRDRPISSRGKASVHPRATVRSSTSSQPRGQCHWSFSIR